MDAHTVRRLLAEVDRPTALVTGASTGLGASYAERLAAAGCDLILVARDRAKLEALQRRVVEAHGVECLVLPADLAQPGAAQRLFDQVAEAGKQVDVLVNNAGFGHYGAFSEQDVLSVERMCGLNVSALASLSNLFARPMVARRCGIIINVGSGAGFSPVPLFSLYAATKAFLLSFSQSLAAELEPHGIHVLCVCPGAAATGFHATALGASAAPNSTPAGALSPEAVVDTTMVGLIQHRRVITPGWKTLVQTRVLRILPARLSLRLAMKAMQKRIAALSAPAPVS